MKVMGKKRGRPRKRKAEKEVDEEEEGEGDSGNLSLAADQQSPNLTPRPLQGNFSVTMNHHSAPSRYPTRHRQAKKLGGQYADLTTTPLRYPVRSCRWISRKCSTFKQARRVLRETSDEASQAANDIPISEEFSEELPLQTQVSTSPASSSGTPRLAKTSKTMENLNSICAESQELQATNDLELEKFASKLIPQNHGPEKSANKGDPKDDHLEPSLSLNLTEIAAMLGDDCSDLDEVGSAAELALVTVNGYRVKPEFASLLRAIFAKHGDIAKDSSFKSAKSRSSVLEMVCGILQKLQNTEFTHITSVELKSMIDVVGDLESVRLELGWLRHRLCEIYEAVEVFHGYSALKEAKSRNTEAIKQKEKDLGDYKAEMLMLQQKLCFAEDELVMMKAETDKINGSVSDTKAKLKCFYGRSLVDGLL